MALISKRDFLKLLILPFSQAFIACVYNKGDHPLPQSTVWAKSSAFLHDFKDITLAGEDEISISWDRE